MKRMVSVLLFALCAAAFAAKPGDAPAAAPPEQQAALAAMQASLAAQRAAVQQQTGAKTESRSGFFVLPPPTPMKPAPGGAQPDCDPLPQSEVDSLIAPAASREGLDAALVRNVIRQESAFRPCAVSPKGAMGLMQLMPSTAERFGVHDALDPAQNVDAGIKLLKQLFVRYAGDIPKILAAYNAGPTVVDEAGGVPDIPETQNYIQRILSFLPKI